MICGGRGLKNKENFEMLYQLSDKLAKITGKSAAVGGTRAAVDLGFVSQQQQIGSFLFV